MDEKNKKLYLDLRDLFSKKGLKISDVAEKAEMAQPTLSNMMSRLKSGKSIKTETLFKILKAIDHEVKLFAL